MAEKILFFAHYILLLIFGIALSFGFSGVELKKRKTLLFGTGLFVFCGLTQLVLFVTVDEQLIWELYPLIVHLPVAVVLCAVFRKNIVTAVAAICTAYLCCQPAKWMGYLCATLTQSAVLEYTVRLLVLLTVGSISVCWLSSCLSKIFNKDVRSVIIFGSVPLVNYLFDYTAGIYTDLWNSHAKLVAEFMPFVLCVAFMAFCMVYYRQYEEKNDAQRREKLISIQAQQQAAQLREIYENEQQLRLLRHDMRHFLGSLLAFLENGETEKASQMIQSYSSHISTTSLPRFCENDMVHYVLTDFTARCNQNNVPLYCTVELPELKFDEILFCAILSNALENALNAQLKLFPEEKRSIRLMLKAMDGKLLLSVKNPVDKTPVFVDGMPISEQDGHGLGTQSIRYISQRLGGNCQFFVQNGLFVVRVVL